MIYLWEQLTAEEQERVREHERAVFKKPIEEGFHMAVFWKPDPPRCHYACDRVNAAAVRAGQLFGREESRAPTPEPVVAGPPGEATEDVPRINGPAPPAVPAGGSPPAGGGAGAACACNPFKLEA